MPPPLARAPRHFQQRHQRVDALLPARRLQQRLFLGRLERTQHRQRIDQRLGRRVITLLQSAFMSRRER